MLALGGAKRMSLSMLRDLTAQQLTDALNEGFAANNPPADQERYKGQLAELLAVMNALGQAKTGEVVALDFVPDSGTRVLVNGAAKGKPIPDEGFYRAILKIWLGDKPADADLKRGLLGQGVVAIPAQAGIQRRQPRPVWIPAFAEMTPLRGVTSAPTRAAGSATRSRAARARPRS